MTAVVALVNWRILERTERRLFFFKHFVWSIDFFFFFITRNASFLLLHLYKILLVCIVSESFFFSFALVIRLESEFSLEFL